MTFCLNKLYSKKGHLTVSFQSVEKATFKGNFFDSLSTESVFTLSVLFYCYEIADGFYCFIDIARQEPLQHILYS